VLTTLTPGQSRMRRFQRVLRRSRQEAGRQVRRKEKAGRGAAEQVQSGEKQPFINKSYL
jgi:hypothetical protein